MKYLECKHLPEGTPYWRIPIAEVFIGSGKRFLKEEHGITDAELHECYKDNFTDVIYFVSTKEPQ